LTHFLCIPLVTRSSRPQLARTLASFRDDVTGGTALPVTVPEGAVRPVGTLHITLGVMSLGDEARLVRATEVLGGLKLGKILEGVRKQRRARMASVLAAISGGSEDAEVEGGQKGKEGRAPTVEIAVRGLHSMQPRAAEAAVLYAAPVDEEGLLQGFCEEIRRVFVEEELVVEDGRPLLLHATILNTVYAKGRNTQRSRKGGGRNNSRLTIDARPILERYDDHVWAEGIALERVAICKMGAKAVEGGEEGDEEYEVLAEVEA
jgi:activating signal cointegrator complex subunit 1